ncbi:MAG: hypothetical protein EXS36_12770 [Pedosphaera sp.]|nr:hypothetical protein [Pedosphaera sp.]
MHSFESAAAWLLVFSLYSALFQSAFAVVPDGPALDIRFLRPPPEPPGPSSRRSGVVISEILYHPLDRDGKAGVQFVEIHNSLPWFEDLSGWRLDGAVQFSFPSNYFLAEGAYVIVSTNPGELRASGITNVFGPFSGEGRLPKNGGRLRLLNSLGAVNFDVEYRDMDPWPIAADGGGHSLVLARPSYGERDIRAWGASSRIGGSPGTRDPEPEVAGATLFINEVLARPAEGQVAFIELFNYSDQAVDITGFILTDDGDRNRFRIPNNTVVGPLGFIRFREIDLDFTLAPAGGKLFLKNSSDTRVLDSLRTQPQSEGRSWGRNPDGASDWIGFSSPTPGERNADPLAPAVVINEILYHPLALDEWEEFVELHNPGDTAIGLRGWKLDGGIHFEFEAGMAISPGGWIVVAKDAARLRSAHPNVAASDIVGNFEGALANRGERIQLVRPDVFIEQGSNGKRVTNTVVILVDEVSYAIGGRWGNWADGGGSSLERRATRSSSRRAGTWADSDESKKSEWVTVQSTGRLELGNSSAPADALEIVLLGKGECLIDAVEVVGPGATNRLVNGSFENGTNGWNFQGTHGYATLATNLGVDGSVGLRLRTTGPGHTGPNRIRAAIRPVLSSGQTATIRARARWLAGTGQILLRLHGNWLEATGDLHTVSAHGTPGAQNSRSVSNGPPTLSDVQHYPVFPTASQSALIVARVDDPDGLDSVTLRWRRDSTNRFNSVPMTNRGAGWFAAKIPQQPSGAVIAFYIEAVDAAGIPEASTFPSPVANRECLIRWGESAIKTGLGVYRLWVAKANNDRWTRREKLSNDPVDATFVYGDFRVIYNSGGMYSGSPYHQSGWSSPTSGNCDYVFTMPSDDPFLGEQEITVLQPGNGGGDTSNQREAQSYWIVRELGLPFCHRRPVLIAVNGVRRGSYDDSQQPSQAMIDQWFPEDADGDLHKIQLWFEFNVSGSDFQPIGADLNNYVTAGGVKKLSRYRWNWAKRAFGLQPHNYTNLFRLVNAANVAGTGDTYIQAVQREVDVDQWFRTHVVEHIVNNGDSFSYGGGQNMYAYRPLNGRWNLMIWDIDFAFNNNPDPKGDLFSTGGKDHGPINSIPIFRRMYWQALLEAAQGPLLADRANPILDARYKAFLANGVTATSPSATKTFIRSRRQYILDQAARVDKPFRILTNDGEDIATVDGTFSIAGTAPLDARTITIDGRPIEVSWTNSSNWTAKLTVAPGSSRLQFGATTSRGRAVDGVSTVLNVRYDPGAEVASPDILSHRISGDRLTLVWRSQPGRRYRTEQSDRIAGTWIPIGTASIAADFKMNATVSTTASARFYRIQRIL